MSGKADNSKIVRMADKAASIKNAVVTSADKKVLCRGKFKRQKKNIDELTDDKHSTVEDIIKKNKITAPVNQMKGNKVSQTEKTDIIGVKKTADRTCRTVYNTKGDSKNGVFPANNEKKHEKKNKKESRKKGESNQTEAKEGRKLAGNILIKKLSTFLSSPQSKEENNMSSGVAKTVYEISRDLGKTYLKKLAIAVLAAIGGMMKSLFEIIFMAIITAILPILPIIVVFLIIINMYSFLFGGVDTTQQKQSSQYYAAVLSKKYSGFDREIRRWTAQGNEVVYDSGNENTDNFADAVALYISFNIESSEDTLNPGSEEYEYEYLIVDTEDEISSIDRAFNLLNYTEDNEDVKHVYKRTLEDVISGLLDEEKNLVSIAKTIIVSMGLPDERINITVCNLDFLWPVISTRITSYYGETEDRNHAHEGVDIGAVSPGVAGDKIYAAADGTVIEATWNDSRGYYVEIDHGDGIMTIYMHMSEFRATAGSTVTKGQVIGYMGTTGNSTGVHLHFGVYIDGETVDPLECEYSYTGYGYEEPEYD